MLSVGKKFALLGGQMPRRRRLGAAGLPHHVLNRACRRAIIFATDDDYRDFMRVLDRAKRRTGMRVLAFAIMPNHWHLLLWPENGVQLSRFMQWLTMTQTQRWHRRHGSVGTGPLYQGRYKAFPIVSKRRFLVVARYVEQNPLRAGLVEHVEDWRWSSAWHRCNNCEHGVLEPWPIPVPADWPSVVNQPQSFIHLRSVREEIRGARRVGRPPRDAR